MFEQSLHDKLSHLKAANPPRALQSLPASLHAAELVSSNLASTVSNLAKAKLWGNSVGLPESSRRKIWSGHVFMSTSNLSPTSFLVAGTELTDNMVFIHASPRLVSFLKHWSYLKMPLGWLARGLANVPQLPDTKPDPSGIANFGNEINRTRIHGFWLAGAAILEKIKIPKKKMALRRS